MDERPAPRFAVGQLVMGQTEDGAWHGPLTVSQMRWGASTDGERFEGWFYGFSEFRNVTLAGECCLRPYDPPADQSYDELMRRLTDPNEYQRNLERDYLTEQYGEPV